jgi:hypothetical protein
VTDPRPDTESELVDYLRSIDVRAPERLHRRIEELVSERSSPRRRPVAIRWRLAGGLALAAVVAVLVASLAGGGSHPLTVNQASVLALRPATAPAPAESPSKGMQLDAAVDGVSFPYWTERFGWRASGSRTDHAGGRTIRTVFYSNARGQRIGYAIVSGTPAPRAGGGSVLWRGGTPFRLTTANGTGVVTWLRDGRLCVVAGRGVHGTTLLALASWHDQRSSIS